MDEKERLFRPTAQEVSGIRLACDVVKGGYVPHGRQLVGICRIVLLQQAIRQNVPRRGAFRIGTVRLQPLCAYGKPLLMVAHGKQRVPEWIRNDVFDRVIKPFSTETFSEPQSTTVVNDGVELLVSTPEQAILECLLLAPQQYSYMDLFYMMEQLTTLRPEMLQRLLETTKSLKTKRMFLYMAEKAGHYWYEALDFAKIDLGTSKLQLAKNGVYISKYKITVPKELDEYE